MEEQEIRASLGAIRNDQIPLCWTPAPGRATARNFLADFLRSPSNLPNLQFGASPSPIQAHDPFLDPFGLSNDGPVPVSRPPETPRKRKMRRAPVKQLKKTVAERSECSLDQVVSVSAAQPIDRASVRRDEMAGQSEAMIEKMQLRQSYRNI
nr:unnamed protein product [Digitaria exilis]